MLTWGDPSPGCTRYVELARRGPWGTTRGRGYGSEKGWSHQGSDMQRTCRWISTWVLDQWRQEGTWVSRVRVIDPAAGQAQCRHGLRRGEKGSNTCPSHILIGVTCLQMWGAVASVRASANRATNGPGSGQPAVPSGGRMAAHRVVRAWAEPRTHEELHGPRGCITGWCRGRRGAHG